MQLAGFGTDIVEVKRVKALAQRKQSSLERIFTARELAYCKTGGKAQYQRLAARFAAKEAVWKALGIAGLEFTAIEVTKDANGKPGISCKDPRAKNISFLLTLSHTENYAVASVLAIKIKPCKK